MNIFIKKRKRGFTLVETLIAVSIFSTSLVVILSVLGKGINDVSYVKEKTTAAYLAEEGLEYMKNIRDTYVLYSADPLTGWNDFKALVDNPCRLNVDGCKYDDTKLPFTYGQITANGPKVILGCNNGNKDCSLDYNNGAYTYHSGNNTPTSPYTRTIKVSNTGLSPDQINVSSQITWTRNGNTFSVVFSDSFYKWVGE